MTLKSRAAETDIEIGRTIRGLRNAAGVSQEKLGEALGITFQQVQKYEKGTNRVAVSTLIAICKAIGAHPMDIIGKHVSADTVSQAPVLVSKVADLEGRLAQIKKLAA